jgi:hypothetical protein
MKRNLVFGVIIASAVRALGAAPLGSGDWAAVGSRRPMR